MRVSPLILSLIGVFTVAPAIALPAWLAWLPAHRPHVTGVHSDFVLPRWDANGVVYYISQQDRMIAIGLWVWLFAAVVAALFVIGRVYYRPLLRALRPPVDMRAEPVDQDAHA